ncbi:unnamed protein product [Cyclocybe aegerita]|uniref:Uncharacterized protein n=1 Tax=Cyclocybe aegerita TaxID=1973307 RepID=A0A8S0WCV5_CYCAE|nr:unnamed protein product [Cyclocybe aegerita]
MSDDEGVEYSPISSPTFAFPLESPESALSATYTPEASPSSLSTAGDPATFKPAFVRGTSFQKALEVARNAESAKFESQRPESLFLERQVTGGRTWAESFLPKVQEQVQEAPKEQPEKHEPAKAEIETQVPAEVAEKPLSLAEEPETKAPKEVQEKHEPTKVEEPTQEPAKFEVEAHEVTTVQPPVIEVAKAEAQIQEPAKVNGHTEDPTTPKAQPPLDDVKVEVEAPETTPVIIVSSDDSTPVVVRDPPIEEAPPPTSPVVELVKPEIQAEKVVSLPSTSPEPIITVSVHSEPPVAKPALVEAPPTSTEPAFVNPAIVDVVPLIIRKRSPTNPVPVTTEAKEEPLLTAEPLPKIEAVPVPLVVVRPASVEPQPLESKTLPAIVEPPKDQPVERIATETQSSASPPDIVVAKEAAEGKASSDNKADAVGRNKAALTLDAERLADDSLMSPPIATGNMTAMSLTDVLSNYFTGGGGPNDSFRTTTPLPVPGVRSPLSPAATLAYDVLETPPPARPAAVKVPDPRSFLSPPFSGFLSGVPSSGNSSFGSIGSRPMSMIETSPGQVARALRMTPATSRGVPMFLPPSSSQPRKSDFVYFPPTPPDAEVTEFGSVIFDSERRRRGSEPDLANLSMKPASFSAVVHGKVRETPASATMPLSGIRKLPATPAMKRVKRATILEPPLSPGQGELVALIQEAVLLEDALDKGELPSEVPRILEEDEQTLKAEEEAAVLAAAKVQEGAERQRIAAAAAQLRAKRDLPTAGRLKHTFLVPLSKARSMHHRKETSSSAANTLRPEEPIIRPKSAGVVEQSGSRSARADFATTQKMPVPPRPRTPSDNSATPAAVALPQAPPPPKSPKSTRFATFRRLGSITARPNTVHGAINRTSNSTSSEISSEDSALAVTPPENNLEFGLRVSPVSESSHGHSSHHGHAQKNSMSFPSLSPKKSSSSVSRATSFAEKMWSRARTKSNGSVLSSTSTDRTHDEGAPRLPAFGPPPAIQLPPSLTSSSASTSQEDVRVLHPPKRSTSLKHPSDLPPIPVSPPPPLPTVTSTSYNKQAPIQPSDLSNDSLLLSPSKDNTRPSSWTSVSSAGSLPSPLFDKALFDAFPSVPGTTPTPMTAFRPHQRETSLGSAANAASSFDSALLSSAIHLASSHKSTATPPTTYQPFPSATRVPATATYAPRRSGETAR